MLRLVHMNTPIDTQEAMRRLIIDLAQYGDAVREYYRAAGIDQPEHGMVNISTHYLERAAKIRDAL